MKSLLLLLCFIFIYLTPADAEHSTDDNWILIEINDHQSAGLMLENPESETAVLIVAGSGPTDHNGNIIANGMINNSYKMLATELHQAGYAVLRFDKQGIGKSANENFDMSKVLFRDYVNDVVAWVKHLKSRHKQVVIIGHSLGGLMAIQAAQAVAVDRLITLASVADSGYITVKRQMNDQPEFVQAAAIPLLDRLALGENIPAAEVPAFLNPLLHPSIQPYLMSFMLIDPKTELTKLNTPTLNIIGDTDLQIKTEETQRLSKNLNHVSLKVINGMNHVLKQAPLDRAANLVTYSQPELPLHAELVPIILSFLQDK